MNSYFINNLVELKDLNITESSRVENVIFLHTQPTELIQSCPSCHSSQVIRRGTAYNRKVRHLPAFECKVFLILPAIRMTCKICDASFVWNYECVTPGKRYTKAFEESLPKQVLGATVSHASRQTQTPASTVERIYKRWMEKECPILQETCMNAASNSSTLVLGIDDFAIRKGHSYNTGLHDLRGETLLDIIPGRKVSELMEYYEENQVLSRLNPIAVVMDLARCYHSFIQAVYPNAIRIADRFHVNGYVTDALHDVRRQVQKSIPSRASKELKQSKRILGKRNDDLYPTEKDILEKILGYSDVLRDVYEWKEAFITWYDCSSTHILAKQGFTRWIEQGEKINHSAVIQCLKTMRNWEEEICNYHLLRFTNAAVEGRNNKIKALQRRHYFTRNKTCYKQRILLECNDTLICG